MKHIILLILLLATCQMAFCQYFSNTDIPELNRKILSYVDSVIGKKVGSGICRELIVAALSNSGVEVPPKYHKIKSRQWPTIYWKLVVYPFPTSNDTVYAGDIITYASHIAIIYKIISPTEYIIAHQNFSGKRKYTKVELTRKSALPDGFILIDRPIPLREQKVVGLDRY